MADAPPECPVAPYYTRLAKLPWFEGDPIVLDTSRVQGRSYQLCLHHLSARHWLWEPSADAANKTKVLWFHRRELCQEAELNVPAMLRSACEHGRVDPALYFAWSQNELLPGKMAKMCFAE